MFLRIKGEREQIEQAIKGINSLRQISIASLDNVHSMKLEIINKLEYHNELTDKALRANGQILEINQVTAYFSYANRTVLGLGVSTAGDIIGLSPGASQNPDNWSHA